MELEHRGNYFVRGDYSPSIYLKVYLCLSLLKMYFDEPNIVSCPSLIDDQRARLQGWALDVGVRGQQVPTVSLEGRLRNRPVVLAIIHELLNAIYRDLKSCKYLTADIRLGEEEILPNKSLVIVKPVKNRDSGREWIQEYNSSIIETVGDFIQRLCIVRSLIPTPAAIFIEGMGNESSQR